MQRRSQDLEVEVGTFHNDIRTCSPINLPFSTDWLRSIRITDCTKVDSSSWRRGIKCNLFAPAEHLLPDPELGDIIILKKVAVSLHFVMHDP
jgi:hypothetical protein